MSLLAATIPFTAPAQLGGLLNKVKNKVQNRADQRVDKEIDRKLDEIEGKNSAAPSSEESISTSPAGSKAEEPGLKSFTKYDFIPGEQVLYYDNFEGEAIAELPTGWNTSGTGEVTTLDKYPGNWLRLHKPFIYLSRNQKEFGENYTLEFDLILQLKNNGWMFPEFIFGVLATGQESTTGNNFLRDWKRNAAAIVTLMPNEYSGSKVRLNSYFENKADFKSDNKSFESLNKYYGTPVHVAVQVQKERFRLWVNEEKLFDVPKGVPAGVVMNQLMFEISHTNYKEEQYGIFISNIKVATGRPDSRHKLIEEGKFSTTGILFDFQSAVIRPESYAVIKDIAGVLKDNASVKVKVLGHTSNDGDDNANLELSRKRAAAVREMLVNEFSIEASRIETEGKGESQPVADNKTREGKALNRRVEFIKL